jgi:DNA-directed RNA polymerase subunit beta'
VSEWATLHLAAPVAHIWFLRGTPSAIGLLLGMTVKNLERITYFASYVVKSVDTEKRDQMIADLKLKQLQLKKLSKCATKKWLKKKMLTSKPWQLARNKELDEANKTIQFRKSQLDSLVKYALMSETDYRALTDDMKEIVKLAWVARPSKICSMKLMLKN